MKKNMKKRNNKGFSLVELIVVVLIMAIIAVALAPQVMKWVGNSRIATDIQNYDSMVANCQLALADQKAYNYVTSTAGTKGDYTIKITSTGTKLYKGTNEITSGDLKSALDNLDSAWSSLKTKDTANAGTKSGATAGQYEITIKENGTVERTNAPKSNSDLESATPSPTPTT